MYEKVFVEHSKHKENAKDEWKSQREKGKLLRKRRYSCPSVLILQQRTVLQSSAFSEHYNAFSITAL